MPQPLAVLNKLDYPRAVLRFYENTVFLYGISYLTKLKKSLFVGILSKYFMFYLFFFLIMLNTVR